MGRQALAGRGTFTRSRCPCCVLTRRNALAWIALGAFVVSVTPRVLGEDWYAYRPGIGLAWLVHMLVPLRLLFVRGAKSNKASQWQWLFAPLVAFYVIDFLGCMNTHRFPMTSEGFDAMLDNAPSLSPLDHWPAVLMLVMLGDTLRRTNLSHRQRAMRLGIGGTSLTLFATLCGFNTPCTSHPSGGISPEIGARCALDVLGAMTACHGAVVVTLGIALLQHRPHASRLPLAGLFAFNLGALIADFAAAPPALALLRGLPPGWPLANASALEPWAYLADLAEGTGLAIAIACWTYAALGQPSLTARIEWRTYAPLIPLVVLFNSSLFAPSTQFDSMQQRPDDAWRDIAGFEPLTRPGVDLYAHCAPQNVSAMLDAEGHVFVLQGNALAELTNEHVSAEREDVNLLVDARASFASLQLGVQALRQFEYIHVTWRYEDLDDAVHARARWPFVEMSNRALRGHTLRLVARDYACPEASDVVLGDAHFTTCTQPREYGASDGAREPLWIASPSTEMPLEAWLRSIDTHEDAIALEVDRALPRSRIPLHFVQRPWQRTWERIRLREPFVFVMIGVLLGEVMRGIRPTYRARHQRRRAVVFGARWVGLVLVMMALLQLALGWR